MRLKNSSRLDRAPEETAAQADSGLLARCVPVVLGWHAEAPAEFSSSTSAALSQVTCEDNWRRWWGPELARLRLSGADLIPLDMSIVLGANVRTGGFKNKQTNNKTSFPQTFF